MNPFVKIMPGRFWVTSVAILAIAGATMTMPDPINQGLPGQITQKDTSSVLARIGVVTEVVEANNIIVNISGSDVLVSASYLFPAYEPLLGDIVYVTKQDAQWFVLGTMSGTINSLVQNPSFEEGTVSTTPDNWTTQVVSSTAGVPTFRKESAGAISGKYVGTFRNASAGVAGTSSLNVFSSSTPADEGTRWALGYFLTYAVPDINASLTPQGGFMDVEGYIQFLDGGGALISETSANYLPIYSSFITPYYARTFTPSIQTFVTAPAGTERARIRIRWNATMHVNSVSEVGIDQVYLRTV